MPDSKSKKKIDAKRIALKQPHEVRYWTKALGFTAKELQAAVAKVGHDVADVRRWLAADVFERSLKRNRSIAKMLADTSSEYKRSAAESIVAVYDLLKFLDGVQ